MKSNDDVHPPTKPGDSCQRALTAGQGNALTGGVDGDNTPSGDERNEPELEPQLGTGGSGQSQNLCGLDIPLRTEAIIERFNNHPTVRMQAASTRKVYSHMFRRLAKAKNIESYTRRQLAGPKGQRLILEHIVDNIPLRSRKSSLSGIEKVWKFGLNLPWPVDTERDIGKLPRVNRRHSPPDAPVRAWYDCIQHEPNPYLKCLWLIMAQSGQRPSTVAKLRWRHVTYDEHDRPCAIIANGADEGFKTFADVAFRIPDDLADALIEVRKSLGEPSDDDPILPWMDGHGRVQQTRETTTVKIRGHWSRLGEKYGLPRLLPVDMRHWVASKCREEPRLHEQARALLMGHEQPINNMGDHYDNLDVETNLERQAERFPHGPLGMFAQPSVELMGDIPGELISALIDYRENRIKGSAVMDLLDTWRMSAKPPVQRVER